MLNLSQPKRSPILLNCVFLLDGGIVLRRFVAFRASTARRRAETYRQNLLHPTSQSPPYPIAKDGADAAPRTGSGG